MSLAYASQLGRIVRESNHANVFPAPVQRASTAKFILKRDYQSPGLSLSDLSPEGESERAARRLQSCVSRR